MANILYLKGSGLGDMISSIPKLRQLKREWNRVSWLFTENFNPSYLDFLDFLKGKWLIDEVFRMPLTLPGALSFGLSHFRVFDRVFIGWMASRQNIAFSRMVGKTVDYRLRSINERIGIVQAENDSQSMGPFHDFDIFEEKDFQEVRTEYRSLGRYAVLYSSAKIKSLKLSEWEGICIFLQENGIQPIIVWGDREAWMSNKLGDKAMSLINRTTFDELAFVLKNAEFCITVDGGIMWLANLVNAQVINIHTFNGRIWEPPVDEKQSFNLRKYHYRNCEPCDWHCRFQGTPRNLECLSYTKKEHIIGIISKYYLWD